MHDRLEKALQIVRETGQDVRNRQQSIGKVEDKTGPMDVVTDVDIETQQTIFSRLKLFFPGDVFWGEESGIPLSDFNSTWVLDPIDGTTNYLHGLSLYSISLAYYSQGKPVVGVIDSPSLGETFWAEKGSGAFLNGKPIRVSSVSDIRRSLVSTGYPHNQRQCDIMAPVYQRLLCRVQALRAIGSAALGVVYVACGRFEGYFQLGVSFYDIAAGVCILEEAGGKVWQIDREALEVTSRSVVAINPLIQDDFFEELAQCGVVFPETRRA
ncbi:MAG: inositol monophosphatase family protein, partial [Candidatus Atribacteria bacterium]|nr:inositol monophosphatase family protein [Candidatus Atribacteria bacterium]